MSDVIRKLELRERRCKRNRKKVFGSEERPRLSVFRSARHVFAQVIDDNSGHTLVSISSFEKKGSGERANAERCVQIGKELAKKCLEKKIDKVVFDKNGYTYHGRVKALADGAREGGLNF